MSDGHLPFVFLDEQLLPVADAKISPLGPGFMAGYGLFETIRIRGGRPVWFFEHFRRLQTSAVILGLDLRSTEKRLLQQSEELIAVNQILEGALKIVLFRDEGTDRELMLVKRRVYSKDEYARGFALQFSSDLRADAGPSHKTTNYLKNLLATEAARRVGYDDALFAEVEGRVYETGTANIFIVRDGKVYTPPANRMVLPGIVRGQILRRWPAATEKEITTAEIQSADEVFITNALLGVMPISRIEQRLYPINDYRVMPALAAAFVNWE